MTGSAIGSEKAGSGPGPKRAGPSDAELQSRWLRAVEAYFAVGGKGVTGLLARAKWRWLGSLRLRVVSTTLVVSAIVVSMLGYFLMQQITANLLNKAKLSAYEQASNGLNFAGSQTFASRRAGASSEIQVSILLEGLKSTGNPADEYGVAVEVLDPAPPVYWHYAHTNLTPAYLPPKVVSQVAAESARNRTKPVFDFARMPLPGDHGAETTGLLFGAPFGNQYALYYFFPLTQLQTELGVVLRALALVGLALVFLLAGIAWLMTRWVVVPVVGAAAGAQQLSTGKLEERLVVRGHDEVAALARSFNEMAASLQEKMRELEDLSQVQRQFVSDVSHELRTPLTTIRMAADLLFESREKLEPQAGRSAELLHSQLGRFESLLVDLLEISRYDANAATLDAELVDVCDLVRNSADVAQQLAERRGSRLEFRLPAEPCVAEVDRRRVERILRNLLVNAVEHGEGREVVVTSASDGGAVAVAVRDHGVGLRPGEETLVFDRFWRADPARARTTGGTGLGLAIALEDARLHGGWLEAWGEPGLGSVFRLTLPRSAGSDLAGSPLPLRPDLRDLDGVLSHRSTEALHPEVLHPEILHPELLHPEVPHPEVPHPDVVRPEVIRVEVVRADPVGADTPGADTAVADPAVAHIVGADAVQAHAAEVGSGAQPEEWT